MFLYFAISACRKRIRGYQLPIGCRNSWILQKFGKICVECVLRDDIQQLKFLVPRDVSICTTCAQNTSKTLVEQILFWSGVYKKDYSHTCMCSVSRFCAICPSVTFHPPSVEPSILFTHSMSHFSAIRNGVMHSFTSNSNHSEVST